MGDFDEIISPIEKNRGAERSRRQMDDFWRTLDSCGLRELGFHGCPFTWSNGRNGVEQIRCRLDRCVGTTDWMALFPRAFVSCEGRGVADHSPMLLALHGCPKTKYKKRRFTKFEAIWMKEKRCEEIIKGVWDENNNRSTVSKLLIKIRRCRDELAEWNRNTVGNIRKRIF
ncbi:hypothetical protein CFOL_v3_08826 [Cephalotus follicularis]|uniref:Exo_endo_phos domain-containing protein n=1 Tax=Cephalotus follicularis TaxID=3775 RepID=A0A1Q3BBC1_CEPFO|nr:hypothetical protein CFOL_v3_08826 [Cephalotus follicularis]